MSDDTATRNRHLVDRLQEPSAGGRPNLSQRTLIFGSAFLMLFILGGMFPLGLPVFGEYVEAFHVSPPFTSAEGPASALAASQTSLPVTPTFANTITATATTRTVTPPHRVTRTPPSATPSPTVRTTPTRTPLSAGITATAWAESVGTAVAATLTAVPTATSTSTPDRSATATREARKIATAVAATLTALPEASPVMTTPPVTPTVTLTPTATTTISPTGCIDDGIYIADVTVPDHSTFDPGQPFDKTWRVQNTGTCDWTEEYKLVFKSGSRMGGSDAVTLAVTPAGQSADITVPLVAPEASGEHTGVWHMLSPAGHPFGQVLTVVIQVSGSDNNPGHTALGAIGGPVPTAERPGVHFGYGIQAHMWDNDLEPIVAATHRLGFNWLKQQIEWKVMEPEKGRYQWGETDRIVNALFANGIRPMFSVVKAPDWSRPVDTDLAVEGPPADPQDYADFMGAMAARYRGRVRAYEIWNEQNLHYEWGNEPLDPARYMTLLSTAYAAIKSADPEAIVISGALTPTGAPQPWAIDDYVYLDAMYQNGLRDVCDAIGAHPSGYNVPPDADWQTWQRPGLLFQGPVNNRHHSWSFKATMEGYRTIAVHYGDVDKNIWPTEFGWASSSSPVANYEYAADNTLEQQAMYTIKAYQMGKAWGWVGVMFLWNLNFKVVAPGSEMAQWGIVDSQWGPLPVYEALAAMPK